VHIQTGHLAQALGYRNNHGPAAGEQKPGGPGQVLGR
jgi:hypothetical protein